MIRLIIFSSYFYLCLFQAECQRPNVTECKYSQHGVEYEGTIHRTESGKLCKNWQSKGNDSIENSDFIDGSKSEAKNYCRNPKGKYYKPWCYTNDPNLIDDTCDVPLCSSTCRITAGGCEFVGTQMRTLTKRKCEAWSEKKYRIYENKTEVDSSKRVLWDDKFPEKSRKDAAHNCRNPTDDVNGPWCLVEEHVNKKITYVKEYCEVEFCSTKSNCSMATGFRNEKTDSVFSHYIKMEKWTDVTMWIQLWNLADVNNASVRIAFSVLPLPMNGKTLLETYTGVEIKISNNAIEFVAPESRKPERNEAQRILSGTEAHEFNFMLHYEPTGYEFIVQSTRSREITLDLTNSTTTSETLIGNMKHFSYYSVQGDAALWYIPCQKVNVCEEHVTLIPRLTIFRKLPKSDRDNSYGMTFFARSVSTLIIELRDGPVSLYPQLRIEIFGQLNKTTLSLKTNDDSYPTYLSSASFVTAISYWKWSEFSLSAIDDRLQLLWMKKTGPVTLFDIRHTLVRNAKWYGIGSMALANWAFFCTYEALPNITSQEPECQKSSKGVEYVGTLSMTKSGNSCIPWLYPSVINKTSGYQFIGISRIKSVNYCRNPNNDNKGTYCFVADKNYFPDLVAVKEYCDVPLCEAHDCRASGTGVNYAGQINVSRSGLPCLPFTRTYEGRNVTQGFCRNPLSSVFGPWCYVASNTTNDTDTDLCLVPDCAVSDSCTIITRTTSGTGRRWYLHPDYVTDRFHFRVKFWSPTYETTVAVHLFFNATFKYHYSLVIKIDNLTNIIELALGESNAGEVTYQILRTKLVSRLIPAAFWQGYWIRVPPNTIELGIEQSPTIVFSYEIPLNATWKDMYTTMISFTTTSDTVDVGLNFPCSYCLVEQTNVMTNDMMYPVNLWSDSNNLPNKIIFRVKTTNRRLKGVTVDDNSSTFISFYAAQNTSYNFIRLQFHYKGISLYHTDRKGVLKSVINVTLDSPLFRDNYWTTLTIELIESRMIIVSDQFDEQLRAIIPDGETIRMYYFNILTVNEITTWVANCPTPDFDSQISGNWSEWGDYICSQPCGGGIGHRVRTCSEPQATYFGAPCIGPLYFDGECNQFECGCLNPATIEKIDKSLERSANNYRASEGHSATLNCSHSLVKSIQQESPRSYLQWFKDGFKLPNTRKLLAKDPELKEINLVIHDAELQHTGIYTCVVYSDCAATKHEFVTVKIIALTVQTEKPSVVVRQTMRLMLNCHSATLHMTYANLHQTWEFDEFSAFDYGSNELSDVNYEIIESTPASYGGEWQCRVNHTGLNLTWITSRIYVSVIDPPTFLTHMIEDDATKSIFGGWNPYFLAFFLFAALIFDIVVVSYVVYWFWKSRRELMGHGIQARRPIGTK